MTIRGLFLFLAVTLLALPGILQAEPMDATKSVYGVPWDMTEEEFWAMVVEADSSWGKRLGGTIKHAFEYTATYSFIDDKIVEPQVSSHTSYSFLDGTLVQVVRRMEYYPTAQVTLDAIAEHLPKLEAAAKEQVFAPQHIVVESLAKANGKNTAGEAELTSVTLTVTITNEENQQAARDRIAEEDRIPLENILMPVLTSVPENAETREHRPRRVPLVPKVENEMERAEGSE